MGGARDLGGPSGVQEPQHSIWPGPLFSPPNRLPSVGGVHETTWTSQLSRRHPTPHGAPGTWVTAPPRVSDPTGQGTVSISPTWEWTCVCVPPALSGLWVSLQDTELSLKVRTAGGEVRES